MKKVAKADMLKLIGDKMSNVCFNLCQRERITKADQETLRQLYREWDDAKATLRKRSKR